MKDINVENFNQSNITAWIDNYSGVKKIEFAIYCGELSAVIYGGELNEKPPGMALDSAKEWVKNPTEDNLQKCKDAAENAYSVYFDCDNKDDNPYKDAYRYCCYSTACAVESCFSDYISNQASSAAISSYATACSIARSISDDYATACSNADGLKEKIINYIKERDGNGELKSKPKTRTEYEKVTDSIFDLKEDFEEGNLFFGDGNYGYEPIDSEADLMHKISSNNVFRKVEKEITWQDEFERILSENLHESERPHIVFNEDGTVVLDGHARADDLLKAIHHIAPITDKPE